MTSQLSFYSDFNASNFQSVNKQNLNSMPPTQRQPDQILLKQFQTLKQINRILDSSPQTNEAKDQKIRSLTIMFKKQLDVNKKLENEIFNLNKKIQGQSQEQQIRKIQMTAYQKKILEQKEKLIITQNENKRLLKVIQQNKQEIKVRQQLIQKMKETFINQRTSMENELHYLKMKTLQHFNQKLKFPLIQQDQSSRRRQSNDRSRPASQSGNKAKNSSKSKKPNIIQRNILTISKNENNFNSGQNLLKSFSDKKKIVERFDQIRKGNYNSALDARFNF